GSCCQTALRFDLDGRAQISSTPSGAPQSEALSPYEDRRGPATGSTARSIGHFGPYAGRPWFPAHSRRNRIPLDRRQTENWIAWPVLRSPVSAAYAPAPPVSLVDRRRTPS